MMTIKPSHPLALYMQGQSPWLPFSVGSGVEGEKKGLIYETSWVLQDGHRLTSSRVVGANHYGKKDTSDGQRLETQIDTFNARHSPKYFGLDKGVSACTVVANHVPLNTKVIGAHEHESHYVFDLLYNNTSDIRPDRHSTDTHGTNQVNFWILYAFGYQFAPRYRDLYKRIGSLVGFQHPSHYGDLLIKPARKVNGEISGAVVESGCSGVNQWR